MKTGNALLGIVAGMAAGAILGILFAPHSGAKTRRIILSKGEGYADSLAGAVDEYKSVLKDKYNELRHEVDAAVKKETA
jgi:gas vesicle protein